MPPDNQSEEPSGYVPSRPVRIALISLITLLVCATGTFIYMRLTNPDSTYALPPTLVAPDLGGPYTLVTHNGEPVTDQDFLGAYQLIYFGYTFCPDVCPTELSRMVTAINELGDAGNDVQPIFITVDPERDTVDIMASYVGLFDDRLIGLTGTKDQTNEAARAYGVYHARADVEGFSDYLVDHSSFIYLMNPDGNLATVFSHRDDLQTIVDQLRTFVVES